MGGVRKLEVPDWKTQTVGTHTPELLENQRKLANIGLKDPWARNEAWKFDRKLWPSPKQQLINLANPRAFVIGLGLAIISAQYTFYKDRKYAEEHGHH